MAPPYRERGIGKDILARLLRDDAMYGAMRRTTDEFLRCIENAFWYFGGVPKTLVIDNLKAAFTQADCTTRS